MDKPMNIDEISLAKMLQQSVCRTDTGLLRQDAVPVVDLSITELRGIGEDLEVQEKTVRARSAERQELDAKLAELVELIQQARKEVAQEVELMKRSKPDC